MANSTSGTPAGEVPSREDLRAYIENAGAPLHKRELAQAFRLKGAQREQLKELLLDLEEAGEIERGEKRTYRPVGTLPEIMTLEVADRDPDGELMARPTEEHADAPGIRIYLSPDRAGEPTLEPGMRVLARLSRQEPGIYVARLLRVLAGPPKRVLGILERHGKQGWLRPTDKRVKETYRIPERDAEGARTGEFLLCEVKPTHRRSGHRDARVVERLGDTTSPKAISLIAIHENDIPVDFSGEAIDEAKAAGPVTETGRAELRHIPFVTIDGPDAKDFDDAVHAEPDASDDNPGGFRLRVAIADVAHYVCSGSALDRAARERGNSVYFPDRVVPMLPEALSNGWCSLRPEEDRGCLAVTMRIDSQGRLLDHAFTRGIVRSRARLTYAQVQTARDGSPDTVTGPLLDTVVHPMFDALDALLTNREQRGTLDLDIAEKQVIVDERGEVTAIEPRGRLDAHRLIEEFMIAANVAAAQTLERVRRPCMYRVHDQPDPDKLESLRQTLHTFDLDLAPDQAGHPSAFKRVLEQIQDRPEAPMINELVLRCQSRAAYSPENIGHFGLALERYAHFTSPIRRYADLLVHRALVDGLNLGEDGLDAETRGQFADVGEHISFTERRAQAAENDAIDRFVAAYLRDRVGGEFRGRVGGVTRFGLFVTLHETGADGLVPIATLPDDFYRHDATNHCLVGQRWGRVYRLGDGVRVKLVEADATTGGLVLELLAVEEPAGDPDTARTGGPEPVSPRGPGKGERRRGARTAETTRKAGKGRKQGHKKAKTSGGRAGGKNKGKPKP